MRLFLKAAILFAVFCCAENELAAQSTTSESSSYPKRASFSAEYDYKKAFKVWAKNHIEEYVRLIEANAEEVRDEFPHFIDTGNQEADAKRYEHLKSVWINNNPKVYEKLVSGAANDK